MVYPHRTPVRPTAAACRASGPVKRAHRAGCTGPNAGVMAVRRGRGSLSAPPLALPLRLRLFSPQCIYSSRPVSGRHGQRTRRAIAKPCAASPPPLRPCLQLRPRTCDGSKKDIIPSRPRSLRRAARRAAWGIPKSPPQAVPRFLWRARQGGWLGVVVARVGHTGGGWHSSRRARADRGSRTQH